MDIWATKEAPVVSTHVAAELATELTVELAVRIGGG